MKIKNRSFELENNEFLITANENIGRYIEIYVDGKKITNAVGLVLDGDVGLMQGWKNDL